MEDVQVELSSKEFIKPSSPTPDHLRHYQLSFLDQLSPKVYNPWILFYTLNHDDRDRHGEFNNIVSISNHLKKSLSQVLSLYYPLAGRVKDNQFVDCNDEGVPFFEAQVSLKLSDVIENTNINELNKFLPFKLDDVTEFALGVQLSVFECGGIAVGVCTSHQLADALSSITFIKTWAATARGEPNISRPEFISATLFPPKNLAGVNPNVGITRKNNITKRFVFKASAIEALRAKYDENLLGEDRRPPSRVEALSAFIWSRFVAATNGESGPHDHQKLYTVLHAVNLRPRFPVYEADFGWGKPIWVGSAALNFHNVTAFIDTKTGDGIEAYLSLKDEDMAKLEVDEEFQAFVSPIEYS